MLILEKKLKDYFKKIGYDDNTTTILTEDIKEIILKDETIVREIIVYRGKKDIIEYDGIKVDFRTNSLYLDNILQPKSLIIVSKNPRKKKDKKTKDTQRTLTPTLKRILTLFLLNPKTVFSREEILNYAWKSQKNLVVDRTVDSHIFRLKKFLKHYGNRIKTVSGLGYSLE
jgi:DNA-binding response OmpR family regulator